MRSTLPALFLALLATACGGSSGKEDDDRPDNGGGNGATVDNSGHTGLLYTSNPEGLVEVDIATGVAVQVRIDGDGHPSADGTELVGIVSDRAFMLDDDAHDTELVIFGRDGRTTQRFGRPDFMYSPSLSPDKQRLAFEYHSIDAGDDGGVDILNITDRAGEVLARYTGAAWWDWAPDGSLYISAGDTILHSPVGYGELVVVKQFPGDAPTDLAVSPDGMRIAFGLGDRSLIENHVYVMNIDGSGVRQLTTSTLNEDAPAWSPDGATIAVRHIIGYAANSAGIPGGTCPEVWLVPADSDTLALNDANERYKMQVLDDDSVRGLCAFSTLAWRAGAAPDRDNGTAISGAGLNAGLTGKVTYDDPEEVVSIDLSSGELRAWTDAGSSPDVSRDGSELLIRSEAPASGDIDDDQVAWHDASGALIGSIMLPGSFLGAPRFSYDGTKVAVRYNGADDGPDWAITVFEREGDSVARFPEEFEAFAWAPDGRILAGVRNLLGMTDAALTTVSGFAEFGDVVQAPAFSPDGSRIAFTMNGHVWVMNSTDGGGLRQLTTSALFETNPEWSPDGKNVLVRYGDSCPLLYVVPADATRAFVGSASVPTTSVAVKHRESGRERTTCAFSRANWR